MNNPKERWVKGKLATLGQDSVPQAIADIAWYKEKKPL